MQLSKPTLPMFPTWEQSKQYFKDNEEYTRQLIKSSVTPIQLLVAASKKKNG